MAQLLHIQSSPREDRSYSRVVAGEFLKAYRNANPDDEVSTLDVFEADLPVFDGFVLQAKYNILHGEDHSVDEKKAWKAVEHIIDDFKSADKYLFSLPMWNFHIPYRLKQYIDIITQPSYTFSFSPDEGYSGLVKGKPATLVYARGGAYPPGSGFESYDLQTKYMETILRFLGFEDIRSVIIEPTLMDGPETAKQKREQAIKEAREMGGSF
jgi:FMN-dependent NADH-azoreductase